MAATAGIPAHAADAAMDDLVAAVATGLDKVALPDVLDLDAELTAKAEQMLEICRARLNAWH